MNIIDVDQSQLQHERRDGWSRRAMLGGVCGASLSACTRRQHDGLSFWAMSYEGDYSPLLMPAFRAQTGIGVEVQSLPWTAAHEKLLTAHAGGSLPDVIMLPDGWVGEFAMIGALEPIADHALLNDLFPHATDLLRHDGRIWAVPWAVAPQALFYRRDLLGEIAPPRSWQDWKAAAHAIRRRRADVWPILTLLNWWDTLFTFAGQLPGRPLRERDTLGNFDNPGFREALAFYKSLFDEGLAPRVLSTEVQDPIGAFVAGQFAFYPIGPELLKDLERRGADAASWSTARMPGPAGPGPVSGVSTSLAVTAGARDRQRAFALIRHLTTPAQELRLQHYIGALPARVSAWQAPVLAADPKLAPFAQQLGTPAAGPNIIEWERIRLEVQAVAERLVRGAVTLAEAPALMNARADHILAKRRQLVASGRLA